MCICILVIDCVCEQKFFTVALNFEIALNLFQRGKRIETYFDLGHYQSAANNIAQKCSGHCTNLNLLQIRNNQFVFFNELKSVKKYRKLHFQ